jgi:hypothetical protein
MPTKATAPTKTFTLTPAGTHVARVFKFMNLGTRYQEYKGEMKDYPDTLINISFELPNELNTFTVKNEDGTEEKVEKPFAISREFTLSMGPKSNLRPIVEGIIGTPLTDEEAYAFDLESLVGMTCLVTIAHKKSKDGDRTFANLVSTAPLMKGMVAPEAFNKPVIQNVNDMTVEEIEALPEWLANKMKVSDEYKRKIGKVITPNTGEKVEQIEYPEADGGEPPF